MLARRIGTKTHENENFSKTVTAEWNTPCHIPPRCGTRRKTHLEASQPPINKPYSRVFRKLGQITDFAAITAVSETFVYACLRAFFFLFFRPVAMRLPSLAQNGWLPVWDTCGTGDLDNKLPREEWYDNEMQYISLHTDCICSENIILIFILQIMSEIHA